jgi:competence protein ComEA
VRVAPILFQKIPINQADIAALMTIPGIGSRLASTIITYRDRSGGIQDRTALMGIPGVGAKKAAMIEAHVRFDLR